MVNRHLKKNLLTSVMFHIAGSRLELIEVTCGLNLTTDQMMVFDWIADSCHVNLL